MNEEGKATCHPIRTLEKDVEKLTSVVADMDMNVNDLLHETARLTDSADLLAQRARLLLWLNLGAIGTSLAMLLGGVLAVLLK